MLPNVSIEAVGSYNSRRRLATFINDSWSPDQKRGSSKSPDNVSQSGYPTNFGTGLGGGAARGIEGQVVSAIFKALVTRFVRSAKEVKASEAVVSNFIYEIPAKNRISTAKRKTFVVVVVVSVLRSEATHHLCKGST